MENDQSTTLRQLRHIKRLSVLEEMLDEKLANLVMQGKPKDDEEQPEEVKNLTQAIDRYREKLTEHINAYRTSHYYLERENQIILSVKKYMAFLNKALESYHYEHTEPMIAAIERFHEDLMTQEQIESHQTNLKNAVDALQKLTRPTKYFQNLFDSPICPICMEHKCDRFLPCGHMFCKMCLDDLRTQSNLGKLTTSVVCALCRSSTTVERVSPLHYP